MPVYPGAPTDPPPHFETISRQQACPPPHWPCGREGDLGAVPTFTINRSTGLAPSYSPAASPRVRRRPSSWPPHRRTKPASESLPASSAASVRCCPAHIHQVGAGFHLERVQALVHLRCTFPSRLPDPDRLAVPIRPVVVGAASHPSLCFQGQAAPCFTGLLRQTGGGFFQPTRLIAPRGALVLVATVRCTRGSRVRL